MPSAPLIRFQAAILDYPDSPYVIEHFLNVGDPEQRKILYRLARQPVLLFDFFGNDYEYRYSKEVLHPEKTRTELSLVTSVADGYWSRLPEGRRDFDRAKDEYQRRYPLSP